MAQRFLVVGGGQQGQVAARALGVGRAHVTVADARPAPSDSPFEWVRVDATARGGALSRLAADADACVVALPGDIADTAVAALARAGARVADMSFVPEPMSPAIGRSARRAGAVVVRDVGVAPGLSHLLAAALHAQLGGLDRLTVFVGGLPRRPPASPFRHAVYFNAVDLLSEYTRPARMRRRGKPVQPDPLDPRQMRRLVDGRWGRLEAFPSDGLRSLLSSFPACHDMEELTLRWPGHLAEMRRLRREGLLAAASGGLGAAALTATALDEAFPGRDFPDVLLMEVHGAHGARHAGWRLEDRGRPGLTAMSRTTAFTAVAVARALASGQFVRPGLHPPEELGANGGTLRAILADVRKQGLRLGRKTAIRRAR